MKTRKRRGGLRSTFWSSVALLSLAASPSLAQSDNTVVLRSADGSLELRGQLISVLEDYYLIQTGLGDMRVSTDKVRCEGQACPVVEAVEVDVSIAGNDAIASGLMPLLLEGLATNLDAEADTSTTTIEGELVSKLTGQQGFGEEIASYRVTSTSSDAAFSALVEQSAQIGLSSRRILPKEARSLSATGAGNMIDPQQEHIIAIDGLVVIVNRSNPVDSVTLAQLGDIYSGKTTNWSQLGGPDLPIQIVTRSQEGGAAETFDSIVFGDTAPGAVEAALVAEDNVSASYFVDENDGAIAYVGFAFKRGQKPLTLVSECGIGTTPDAFSVKAEEYQMFRRLFAYRRGDVSDDNIQQLLGYISSPASSSVIRQAGFVDLAVERVGLGGESERAKRIAGTGTGSFERGLVEKILGMLQSNDRLSSTFRFRTGSTALDARARDDLFRLSSHLESLPDGTQVTLVGFADSVGAFEPNVSLSEDRAKQVKAELLALGEDRLDHLTINTVGFGELSPASCNSSDTGRRINRRVETWVSIK